MQATRSVLYFRAKFWPRPVRRASIFPRVTIVLAVHNEEKNLPGKLLNLAALDYPADRLEVIVISDGSTDETNKIASAWQNSGYRAVILPEHRGKANALNYGIAEAQGEIICFTDARQKIASDGLKNLVANFADPSVGCASGELILRGDRKYSFVGWCGPVLAIRKKYSKLGGTGRIDGRRNGSILCGTKGSALAPSRRNNSGRRIHSAPSCAARQQSHFRSKSSGLG